MAALSLVYKDFIQRKSEYDKGFTVFLQNDTNQIENYCLNDFKISCIYLYELLFCSEKLLANLASPWKKK